MSPFMILRCGFIAAVHLTAPSLSPPSVAGLLRCVLQQEVQAQVLGERGSRVPRLLRLHQQR